MLKTNKRLKEYYHQYILVSKVLVIKKVLNEINRGRLFLIKLPK